MARKAGLRRLAVSFGRHGKEPASAGRSRLLLARKEPAFPRPKAGFFWPEKEPASGQRSRLPSVAPNSESTSLRGGPFGPSPRSCTMSFPRPLEGPRSGSAENTLTAPNGNVRAGKSRLSPCFLGGGKPAFAGFVRTYSFRAKEAHIT